MRHHEENKTILAALEITPDERNENVLERMPLSQLLEIERHLIQQEDLRTVLMIMVDEWRKTGVPMASMIHGYISDAWFNSVAKAQIKNGGIPAKMSMIEAVSGLVAVGALTMSIIMLYFVGSPSPLLGELKACGRKLVFTKGDGLCFASFGELSALLTKANTEEIEVNATEVMGWVTKAMRDAATTQWSFGNDK